jgi:hypothetical protein
MPAGTEAPYDGPVTGTAKLASTALLFAVALGILALAAATHSAVPLFFMWLPLLGVPLVLVRPGPGHSPPAAAPQAQESDEGETDA